MKTTAGRHHFEGMLQKLGIQTLRLENILSTISGSRNATQTQSVAEAAEEYDESHIRAVRKIQRFWRHIYPQVREERDLMKTSQGRLIIQVKAICRQYSVSEGMRDLLTSQGLKLHEMHRAQSAAADKIQQRAVRLACTSPQDRFETINQVIDRIRDTQQELDSIAANVSVDRLHELAREELTDVHMKFRMVNDELHIAERDMREARQLLETIE